MFDFKLTGADSISKEYKAFNTKVYKGTQAGLTAVGSEMTKQLQKHIQDEVYSPEVYTPKSYMRRIDYGGGTPIISPKNMDLQLGKMSLTFSYEPSGRNTRYPDSDYVDGDELINAIENSDYTWHGTEDIPKRHFWNNFVDDMVGASGQAERIFVKGMNAIQPDLQASEDGNIHTDGNETIFPQQLKMQYPINTASNRDDDGELPY